MKKSSKRLWIAVIVGILILFMFILLAAVLNLGAQLSLIHPYVGYGFYGLCIILVWFLILNPVRIIAFSPAFNIETVLDKPSRHRFKTYQKVAKTLIKNGDISDKEANELKLVIKEPEALQAKLNEIFNSTLKKKINKLIFSHAKTVLISTAISQNGRWDLIASFIVNLRMIKSIVQMSGFRPNFKNLAKLTINVFSTALIAEGLENLDLTEILPTSSQNFLKEIPFARMVTESITQGISNAILTLRIGIITRKYLFADSKELSKKDIRRGAFIETFKIMPNLVKESISGFPQKIREFFTFKKKEEADPA